MAFSVRSVAAIALVFVIAVAYQVDKSAGADYVVGDSLGWTIPSGGAASYSSWAAGHTFMPGEVLVFNFPTGVHDVAKVDKASFDSCSASNPTTLATVGPARLTLTSAEDQYFICTFGQHCAAGQKLTLKVTAAASTPPPTPPPPTSLPPPAEAPKPTPASPPSTPTTSSPPPSFATPAPPTIAPMPPSSGSGSTMTPTMPPSSSSSGSTPPAMTPTMPPSSSRGSTPTMTPTMPPSSSSGSTPPAMAPTMPPPVAGGPGVLPGPLTPGGGLGPSVPTIAPAGSATNRPTGSATTTTASTLFGLVVAIATIAINCY